MNKPRYTREIDREQVTDMLRTNGITPTRQRVEIAFALFSRWEHVCADQLMAIVNEGDPEVSKATVYNTLNLLREKGLIRQVIVDPTRVFFDPNTGDHHHMYDVVTGTLVDLDPDAVAVTARLPIPDGMVAEGIDVVVRVRPRT